MDAETKNMIYGCKIKMMAYFVGRCLGYIFLPVLLVAILKRSFSQNFQNKRRAVCLYLIVASCCLGVSWYADQ